MPNIPSLGERLAVVSADSAHMQKEKAGNLIGLQKHIDRKNKNYQNENIDLNLSDQNYFLTNNHDKQSSLYQEVKNYVDDDGKDINEIHAKAMDGIYESSI